MIYYPNESGIKKVAYILRNGGVVAIPTETVYGLAANALDETAVKKIFAAKKRPPDNPLIVHISDKSELEKYTYPNNMAYKLADAFWPGPLTIILPKKEIIPTIVSANLESVAIRLPSSEIARGVIDEAGVPLAAPSANLSGKPSPTKAKHVIDDFKDSIDGVLDGGSCSCGVESTVVSLLNDKPVLLRPGFVTVDKLQKVIGEIVISDGVLNIVQENEKVMSPGLKHKHYAPQAFTECVIGEIENVRKYIELNIVKNKKSAVICFDGEEKYFNGIFCCSYGNEKQPETLAQNIFDVLRRMDDMKIERIFIHANLTDGIGLAVFNRLLRACAFNVTDADKLFS